ncbi:hypothetical protein B9Z19DRAFT_1107750 [Tuber borchii]|uniref:Uncharacterized protein n=1 Tax=Tuber borchii TaxID=42251 RepID=A0A2T6ZV62_TUBBO|nr:hypothetical protein B9Z19DRAFT_1107750 [Tuber borchii]
MTDASTTPTTPHLLQKLNSLTDTLTTLLSESRKNTLAQRRTHKLLLRLESLSIENAWIRHTFPTTPVLTDEFFGGDVEGDADALREEAEPEFERRYGITRECLGGIVHRDVLRVISRRGSLVVVCGGVLSREWEDTYRGFLEGWLERGDGEGALTEEEVNVVNRLLEYVPKEGGGEQDAFNAVDAGRAINGQWEDRRFIRDYFLHDICV